MNAVEHGSRFVVRLCSCIGSGDNAKVTSKLSSLLKELRGSSGAVNTGLWARQPLCGRTCFVGRLCCGKCSNSKQPGGDNSARSDGAGGDANSHLGCQYFRVDKMGPVAPGDTRILLLICTAIAIEQLCPPDQRPIKVKILRKLQVNVAAMPAARRSSVQRVTNQQYRNALFSLC